MYCPLGSGPAVQPTDAGGTAVTLGHGNSAAKAAESAAEATGEAGQVEGAGRALMGSSAMEVMRVGSTAGDSCARMVVPPMLLTGKISRGGGKRM